MLFLNKLNFIFYIWLLITPLLLNAQNPDSVQTSIPTDSLFADSIQTSLWPALIRSAIVPGWGQIEQENPGRAVIFYGLSLSFLYNIGYNYYWYDRDKKYIHYTKMRRFGFLFLQLYAINIADVIETHRKGKDKPWPEDPFGDQPLKSPWGAVARSAMLPGWGQCYNESYIKSILAFGSAAYFINRIIEYGKKYKRTQDVAYKDKRVTNSWYLGFAYLIILADAYVDAYLYRFDDIVKLSYNVIPVENTITFGVNIEF